MTGGALLGLILLSMAWCFFLFGLTLHLKILRRSLQAKPGEVTPSGM
jgi:hypothetical protein